MEGARPEHSQRAPPGGWERDGVWGAAAAAVVDRGERARLYAEIQDIIVREVPYWWLVETDQLRAFKKEYRDLQIWSGNLAERAWWEEGR